ncbi:TerB N-terminal domain-containing protein [Virgibacillus natechei]
MEKEKSLLWGYVLAFFLGGIGAHLFYYRKYIRGVLYLLFSWTYIPILLGWIDMFFLKKWMNQVNEVIRNKQKGDIQYNENFISLQKKTEEKKKDKADKESEVYNAVEDKSKSEKVTSFFKDSFTFYDEKEIILPKYSHLKAHKDLLAHLKKADDTVYEKEGIRLTVSMSTSNTDFTKNSLKYSQKRGIETKDIPFQSYWPTFRDLDKRQLKWYFYWREQVLKGNYIEVDLSYIFIFIYELLNYSFNKNAAFDVSMLVRLLDNYKEIYPKLEGYLSMWIADMLYELGEVELAGEWEIRKEDNEPKLYTMLQEKTDGLESISMSVWKPYIRNYRETTFFPKNKNKIYKKFKQSIPLIQEAYRERGTDMLNEWFEVRDSRNIRYLFNSAVVDRVDRQIHVKGTEYRPTETIYEVLSNLFRLTENVVRIEEGEKRQIKVDEEMLPENMKEKMIKVNKRFKTVQSKKNEIKGSSIPTPPEEVKAEEMEITTQQEQPYKELEFDWDEINKKEEELSLLQNKIEATEYGEGGSEKVEAAATTTTIETENIQTLSEENVLLDKTDNEPENEITLDSMFTNDDGNYDEFIEALTDSEMQFLLLFEDNFLSMEKAKEFTKKQGSMLGLFITEINEKADVYLEDIFLEENENTIEIVEDFEEIIGLVRGAEDEN